MSRRPSGPGPRHRYRTEDPYDEHEGAGYRLPEPRTADGPDGYGSSYGTTGQPGQPHRYGEGYDPVPADDRYGGPAYGDAYGQEAAYGAYNRDAGYGNAYSQAPGYGQAYGQEPTYGAPYGQESSYGAAYGQESSYGAAYNQAPQHGGHGADPAYAHQQPPYGSDDDPRYGRYGQPTAEPYRGYGSPIGSAHSTTADRRVDPLPALDDEPAAPRRKSSRKVLLVLAALLVLAVGAGTAAVLLRPELGLGDRTPVRLTTPDTLAGRPKITDGELQKLANELVTTMKRNVPEATSTVAAFYGDPAKKNMVMVAGASGRVSDPAGQLDRAMREMAAGGLAVRDPTAAEPGPLGGEARCGDATSDGVPMGVCVWSDRGSLVLVVVYFTTGQQAKTELPAIRAAIQQQG
jgi:hypothetical protein